MSEYQHTVERSAVCAGIGLHSGARARVNLGPAAPGTGIVFVRTDVTDRANLIQALARYVGDTMLGTSLINADGVSVSTVEHFLAACAGMGIDNLRVEIDGPEMPILDGSAAVFAQLLAGAGRRAQPALRRRIEILETIEVRDGDKWARFEPGVAGADDAVFDVEILFKDPAIGRQRRVWTCSAETFAEDVSEARTFGFLHEVEALKAMGRARGGSLDNAIVVENGKVLNEGGLRFEDEFVRHKILDAVGDLYLLGAPFIGRFEASQTGHALNSKLVRALLASPKSWCWNVAAEAEEKLAAVN
ncbi:MAG: UDP-3-O-acyl-N-acetylglucosamine deacetylase [Caulobacterales bacterium]